MSLERKFVVLGAGISGLTATKVLQEKGCLVSLLEECPNAGGLTRSIYSDKFCFDYSGHLLHLSRYDSPSNIPYADLKDEDWIKINKQAYCYMGNRFIPAPVQYHMGQLPEDIKKKCIESYNCRPILQEKEISCFREYVESGFGSEISKNFLIPQNEKTMAISIDEMSVNAIKRFFPKPNDELIRAGFEVSKHEDNESNEYNSRFWYPKKGGIQALVDGLEKGVKSLYTLNQAVNVDVRGKKVTTKTGAVFDWDILLSSIPLTKLCAIINDDELNSYVNQLSHGSTVIFNLGVKGDIPENLKDVHWIYVPDKEIPFYRFGVYSNMSQGVCPPGYHALYIEVGVPAKEVDRINIPEVLYPQVISSLKTLNWVDPQKIVCDCTNIIKCSYVHHTHARELIIDKIFNRLNGFGIFPIGRYGTWDYTSMEDSIYDSIKTVEHLI